LTLAQGKNDRIVREATKDNLTGASRRLSTCGPFGLRYRTVEHPDERPVKTLSSDEVER